MHTAFLITGGAGRVIAAIPALEKYLRLNPGDDVRVMVSGWESVFWSHPTLQHRTFGAHQKGNFDCHIRSRRAWHPEPYLWWDFYNQNLGLVDAFDAEINRTDQHGDLSRSGYLHVTGAERARAREIVGQLQRTHDRRRTIMLQPFGSTTELINHEPLDRSNRSMRQRDYLRLAQRLAPHALILYASPPQFRHVQDSITVSFDQHQPYLRTMMALMTQVDYFVGVCSVGQHVARAFGTPGTVIMGATSEINYSYPDHFDIYRADDRAPVYTPWRLSDADCEFSDRANDGIMHMEPDEIDQLADRITQRMMGQDTGSHDSDAEPGSDAGSVVTYD